MEGGTGEGYREFILRLQRLCAAIRCVSVELFRATFVTQYHTHFEGINALFEVILGNKKWAGLS